MTELQAIILGIVEGITEFLPISSTAHLILVSKFLKIPSDEFIKFFDVFIQSAAILAIIISYFKYIFQNKKLIFMILISFFITAFIIIPFYKIIKSVFFESISLIIFNTIIIGILILLVEYAIGKGKLKNYKSLEKLNYKEAILIGIFQSLSMMPGISRAGIVILAMLLLKYKREDSAIYSFLLSVPTIISAGIFDLYKTSIQDFSIILNNIEPLIWGCLFSFFSALIVVKFFIEYLKTHTFKIFGWYRILLGIILILVFGLG